MARTNVLTTAKRIRRQVLSNFRHEQARLQSDITNNAGTFTVDGDYPNALTIGALVAIDLEVMLITAVDVGAKTVNVVRGYMDSEAVAHTTASLIDINPRFTLLDIVEAMRTEISTWAPTLYYPLSDTLTASTTSPMLELPADWISNLGIIDVRQSVEAVSDYTVWPEIGFKYLQGDVATFDGATTSGMLLRFTEPIVTGAVYVTVAMPYAPGDLATTVDLATDLFLTDGMIDLLELGVKRRLLLDEMNSNAQRNSQDDSRLAQETPIGSLVPLGQVQSALYTQRMQQEAALLRRRFPIKMR